MIVLPASLSADITNNTLTWSFIIRFETKSGYVFGYTSYDESITYSGVNYTPGLSQTELTKGADSFVSNIDLELLLETDVSKGFLRNLIVNDYYDGTRYKLSIINHNNPSSELILQSGITGEFTVRDRRIINVELRSLTQILKEQSVIELYTPSDKALLGDEKNGLDLSAYTTPAIVYEVINSRNQFRFVNASKTTVNNITFTSAETVVSAITSADLTQLSAVPLGRLVVNSESTSTSGVSITYSYSLNGGSYQTINPETLITLTSANSDTSDIKVKTEIVRTTASQTAIVSSLSIYVGRQPNISWAENNYYAYGKIKWTNKSNYIPSVNNTHYFENEIRLNVSSNRYFLQKSTAFPVSAGATAELIAGYDGSIDQALNKFDNVINFRGFPLIPGNNKLLETGDVNE